MAVSRPDSPASPKERSECPSSPESPHKNFDSWILPASAMHRKLKLLPAADGSEVPPEEMGSVWFGICVHLGPVVIYFALLHLFGHALWQVFSFALGVMLVNLLVIVYYEYKHPAVGLEAPSLSDMWEGAVLVFITAVGVGSAVVFGSRHLFWHLRSPAEAGVFSWWLVAYATMLDDFLYYIYHRFLSHGTGTAWFQTVHLPHHSVVALDFWRGNLSSVWDTAVLGFQLPLGVVASLYGLSLEATFVVYFTVLMLQATHHANHTFNIGTLRFVFVDNHAHKMHHCPWGSHLNHGACFAMWDRNLGTFFEDASVCTNYAQLHKVQLAVRPTPREADRMTVLIMGFIFALFALPIFVPPLVAGTVTVLLTCSAALLARACAHDTHAV
eukprot:Hpha_TRINITY_DN15318_c3_g2::TRINITY_DN15318_c3_g2_i4::g.89810::m.89810